VSERPDDFRFLGYSGLVVLTASLSESDPKETSRAPCRGCATFAVENAAQALRPRSVTLDNALAAARGLEPAAKLVGLASRRERPHHGAIINPLGAKVGASNNRGAAAE
jgi:hypothetical protein